MGDSCFIQNYYSFEKLTKKCVLFYIIIMCHYTRNYILEDNMQTLTVEERVRKIQQCL